MEYTLDIPRPFGLLLNQFSVFCPFTLLVTKYACINTDLLRYVVSRVYGID